VLAAGVVPAIILTAALIAVFRDALVRWGLVIIIGVLAIGLVTTESRGGLLAALSTIVVALVVVRRARFGVVALAAVALAVAGLWFASSPGAWHRVTSYQDQGSGRQDLWRVARQISADHPIVGVGLGNFQVQAPRYTQRPGELRYAHFVAETPNVAHNTFLQLSAETGIVGLVLFLTVVISCLRAAWRAGRSFDASGDSGFAALSQAIVVAIIAFMVAAFFLSMGTDPRWWVVLAMGPVLAHLARDGVSRVRREVRDEPIGRARSPV
jgi:O-antigen ligase